MHMRYPVVFGGIDREHGFVPFFERQADFFHGGFRSHD